MRKIEEYTVSLSVRDLVEFVLKSGSIDQRRTAAAIQDAMLLGARVHREIQKRMGESYSAEVPLKTEFTLCDPGDPEAGEAELEIRLRIEGRADGIISLPDGSFMIDEIKGVYRDILMMEGPEKVHLAQAEVYALIFLTQHELEHISVQLTYVQLEEEEPRKEAKKDALTRRFVSEYSAEELRGKVQQYIDSYKKWAFFVVRHRLARKASVQDFPFPYPYRPGQEKIVRQVYRTEEDRGRLFVQAPTGIGKTLAMLYPSVQAVGRDLADKIFYLTAKTVTSGVAEEGMRIFGERGLKFSYVKINAKEKMCPLAKAECNPDACERANGHMDRVNEAVYDLITHETAVSGEVISTYAAKHCVCPYELSLDVSYYTDVIICDYNYAFAPNVFLRRYFADGADKDYIFLMDEAHNLVDRAREMYSAMIVKEDLLAAKKLFPGQRTILKWIEQANQKMLALKRECEQVTVFTEDSFPNALLYDLMNLTEAVSRFLDRNPNPKEADRIRDFFFNLRDFIETSVHLGEDYISYASFDEDSHFFVRLFCIQPSVRLRERLDHIQAAVFFSATFLPINYYKELLTGDREEDAIYVDSPFDPALRRLMIAGDVSTRYTRRGRDEYRRIAEYLVRMAGMKQGNYLAFFPSHSFLNSVREELLLTDAVGKGEISLLSQTRIMSEEERAAFLRAFTEERESSLLALSVMGGVFSEGIDLKYSQLIGVAVVGTGLPMVCTERELIRAYYDRLDENGFDFAYRFPGFNKVMQAAGRLIRTSEDFGIILLMDERFRYRENLRLFPKEWEEYDLVTLSSAGEKMTDFWDNLEESRKIQQ